MEPDGYLSPSELRHETDPYKILRHIAAHALRMTEAMLEISKNERQQLERIADHPSHPQWQWPDYVKAINDLLAIRKAPPPAIGDAIKLASDRLTTLPRPKQR